MTPISAKEPPLSWIAEKGKEKVKIFVKSLITDYIFIGTDLAAKTLVSTLTRKIVILEGRVSWLVLSCPSYWLGLDAELLRPIFKQLARPRYQRLLRVRIGNGYTGGVVRWGLGQVFLAPSHCAIDCPIVHLRETFSSELLIVNNWYWRWKWLNIFGLQEAWIIHIFHVKLPFVYSEKIGNVCCSPYKLVGFHWVHPEIQYA